jgi:hypothetical protein
MADIKPMKPGLTVWQEGPDGQRERHVSVPAAAKAVGVTTNALALHFNKAPDKTRCIAYGYTWVKKREVLRPMRETTVDDASTTRENLASRQPVWQELPDGRRIRHKSLQAAAASLELSASVLSLRFLRSTDKNKISAFGYVWKKEVTDISDLPGEVWKPYGDIEASNLGRVKID